MMEKHPEATYANAYKKIREDSIGSAPVAAEAASIDTVEFHGLLHHLRLAVTLPAFNAYAASMTSHIDARLVQAVVDAHAEGWTAGRRDQYQVALAGQAKQFQDAGQVNRRISDRWQEKYDEAMVNLSSAKQRAEKAEELAKHNDDLALILAGRWKKRADKTEAELSEWVHTNKIDVLQRDLVKAEAELDAALKRAERAEGMHVTMANGNAYSVLAIEAALAQVAGRQVPVGYVLIAVNHGFEPLIAALDYASRKGSLPDALVDEWEAFEFKSATPQPAPVAGTVDASAELSHDSIRAAGGIVHKDGNIFFKNLDVMRAALATPPAISTSKGAAPLNVRFEFETWFSSWADPNVGGVETSIQKHAAWMAWQAHAAIIPPTP